MLSSQEVYEERQRLEDLVSDLSYKPGWWFHVPRPDEATRLVVSDGQNWYGFNHIYVTAQVRDVTDPNPQGILTVLLSNVVAIPYGESEDVILHRLHSALVAMEHHEIDEWFRRDGKTVNDPHPIEEVVTTKLQLPGML